MLELHRPAPEILATIDQSDERYINRVRSLFYSRVDTRRGDMIPLHALKRYRCIESITDSRDKRHARRKALLVEDMRGNVHEVMMNPHYAALVEQSFMPDVEKLDASKVWHDYFPELVAYNSLRHVKVSLTTR